MAQYGELLENQYEDLYQNFANYFNNPNMTKTKNVNGYSVYMCKTYCLLSTLCRYIIVLVEENSDGVGFTRKLNTLSWVSFQTRTLSDNHNVETHGYNPSKKSVINVPIERTKITEEASIYDCSSLPITITLLHTNKNTPVSYQNRGTVVAALETYETVITLKK